MKNKMGGAKKTVQSAIAEKLWDRHNFSSTLTKFSRSIGVARRPIEIFEELHRAPQEKATSQTSLPDLGSAELIA